SIRGSWFTAGIEPYKIVSCGLYDGDKQVPELVFKEDEDLREFIQDIVDFYETETVELKHEPE
ncbi:hypothetical protein OFL77_27205, partial [Escherichia coli]|uniref:hypothetical protein n=1 Tax=Escherichia coli TaxID=562 RepID=UPI0021E01B39